MKTYDFFKVKFIQKLVKEKASLFSEYRIDNNFDRKIAGFRNKELEM